MPKFCFDKKEEATPPGSAKNDALYTSYGKAETKKSKRIVVKAGIEQVQPSNDPRVIIIVAVDDGALDAAFACLAQSGTIFYWEPDSHKKNIKGAVVEGFLTAPMKFAVVKYKTAYTGIKRARVSVGNNTKKTTERKKNLEQKTLK
jgi:hypothetical protein